MTKRVLIKSFADSSNSFKKHNIGEVHTTNQPKPFYSDRLKIAAKRLYDSVDSLSVMASRFISICNWYYTKGSPITGIGYKIIFDASTV